MKKEPFLHEFLDPILIFKCPRESLPKWHHQFGIALFFWLLMQYFINEWRRRWNYASVMYHFNNAAFFKRRRHGEAGYVASDVFLKQAECWACFPCIRPNTLQLHIAITELLRSQLCPIAYEYGPHVIVITGNNFTPVLTSALLRI